MELVLSSLNAYLFDITVNDLQHQYRRYLSKNSLLVLVPKIEKLIQFEAEWIKQTQQISCSLCVLSFALLPISSIWLTLPILNKFEGSPKDQMGRLFSLPKVSSLSGRRFD